MRFLLKYKLILLVLVPIALLMITQIYHYIQMSEEKDELMEGIIIPHRTFLEKSVNIQSLTTEIAHLIDEAILYARDGDKEKMILVIEELQEHTIKRNADMEELQRLVEQYDSEEGKATFAAVEESMEQIDTLNQEIITKLMTSGETEKTAGEIMRNEFIEVAALEDIIIEDMHVFNEQVFREIDYATLALNTFEQSYTAYLINTSIIGIIALIIVLIVLYFQIIVPLNELTIAIQEISTGNYKIKINKKKRSDELGILAQAIEELLYYLQVSIQTTLHHQLRGKKK